jgi:F-box interacting protein
LISSPKFISMHAQHSESTGNYAQILHCRRYRNSETPYQLLNIDGSFSEFQELGYPCQNRGRYYKVLDCKGLILFTTDNESHILWNPAIRMSMTLPRPRVDVPKGKHCVHGFGFDHRSNDYKVLRMVQDIYGLFPVLQVELYRLRTGAWETFTGADDFLYHIAPNTQAFVNGASHWFGYLKREHMLSDVYPKRVVVLFDMCDEQLRVMKLPNHLGLDWDKTLDLGVSGGLLSLMEYNGRQDVNLSCSIWLMKEYGVAESWTKQSTIALEGWSFGRIFCFRNNENILAWNRENEKESVLYIKAEGSLLGENTLIESLVLLDKVNPMQTRQTCLRKCQWADSKKGKETKEKKRKTCTPETSLSEAQENIAKKIRLETYMISIIYDQYFMKLFIGKTALIIFYLSLFLKKRI